MENQLQIFSNPEFGEVRTKVDEKGEPWFCAKDVCDALGYKQTHKAVERHVDDEDGMKTSHPYDKRNSADALCQRKRTLLSYPIF